MQFTISFFKLSLEVTPSCRDAKLLFCLYNINGMIHSSCDCVHVTTKTSITSTSGLSCDLKHCQSWLDHVTNLPVKTLSRHMSSIVVFSTWYLLVTLQSSRTGHLFLGFYEAALFDVGCRCLFVRHAIFMVSQNHRQIQIFIGQSTAAQLIQQTSAHCAENDPVNHHPMA